MHSTANTLADCDKLSVKSGCLCPGRNIVYECAVSDDTLNGLTVWKAPQTNTNCGSEITLPHNEMDFNLTHGNRCADLLARGVDVNGNCYYSQLTVNASTVFAENESSLIEGNVTCLFDNGSEIVIDYIRLSIPSAGKLYELN